jgi:hypothetical protein
VDEEGRMRLFLRVALLFALASLSAVPCRAFQAQVNAAALAAAFEGAQVVDLRTCKVSSVVKLREVVGIPPPSGEVLVKAFDRNAIPYALKPAFPHPGIAGVTILGRYIAILRTEFGDEYEDVLRHELVHAYIVQASPKPLPFWFQEGSAVHFSTDRDQKLYGRPSRVVHGATEAKVVDIAPNYKQKLQSFHYLIEKVGKKRFYAWYKNAVMTGVVNARPLLGLGAEDSGQAQRARKPFPIWLAGAIAAVVIAVVVTGYYATRQGEAD